MYELQWTIRLPELLRVCQEMQRLWVSLADHILPKFKITDSLELLERASSRRLVIPACFLSETCRNDGTTSFLPREQLYRGNCSRLLDMASVLAYNSAAHDDTST